MYWKDGKITAIELSRKRGVDLVENLMELVRGESYLQFKAEHGARSAKELSRGEQSKYSEIRYFGPPGVCGYVQRVRRLMLEQGDLSKEEARCICVKSYPLAQTEAEFDQEEEEDYQALGETEQE
jgi:hypothetical protein